MVVINCKKCGREFKLGEGGDRVASMSGSIMGDEYIESYYYCNQCGTYTLEVYRDNFTGTESASVYGPLTKVEGDAKVEIIRRCSEPWEKKCRCEAHREYFGDNLD